MECGKRMDMVDAWSSAEDSDFKGWLEIYANLQSPKMPKSISDKVPYRSVTILRYESKAVKNEEEKARSVEKQLVDFAPRQRVGAHCALCKIVLGGQTHYCALASTALTRSRTIRLVPVS
ncbi:hypothetical protein TNCV_1976501 [Trichonephila clavipes]|nr:hypothetical protein TNCV_1976501 [Trichonephila clavipes]